MVQSKGSCEHFGVDTLIRPEKKNKSECLILNAVGLKKYFHLTLTFSILSKEYCEIMCLIPTGQTSTSLGSRPLEENCFTLLNY